MCRYNHVPGKCGAGKRNNPNAVILPPRKQCNLTLSEDQYQFLRKLAISKGKYLRAFIRDSVLALHGYQKKEWDP